jgi:peptidyl-prolyl cis-trans isomerase B (cyclophilin B)
MEVVKVDPIHYWVPVAATSETQAPQAEVKGVIKKMEPTVANKSEIRKLPSPIVKKGMKYTARIEMQKGGVIEISLNAEKAPYTVSNFLHLARNHFYDGVSFHRVIPGFMAQGGDPTGRGSGGPGYKFDNEDNDLKHVRGALSMAHAGRDTNGSQFFICYEAQPHLDGLHVVFALVTSGMDVVDQIKQGDVMKKVEVFEEAPRG